MCQLQTRCNPRFAAVKLTVLKIHRHSSKIKLARILSKARKIGETTIQAAGISPAAELIVDQGVGGRSIARANALLNRAVLDKSAGGRGRPVAKQFCASLNRQSIVAGRSVCAEESYGGAWRDRDGNRVTH